MKKYTGLTKRITAMLLSGMLVLGAVPCSALAVSTDAESSQASEVVIEDTSSEEPMNTALEEPAQYYTITLDANGGYFENEWDDTIDEIVERAEVVTKQVPVGGTVPSPVVPVFMEPDGQSMLFAGWSLERDGELVITGDEEYTPVDDCVLYAVWELNESGNTGESTDTSWEDIDQNDIGFADEGTDLTADTQELNEEEEEDTKDSHIEENTNPDANSVPDIEENVTTTNQQESKRNFEPERLEGKRQIVGVVSRKSGSL